MKFNWLIFFFILFTGTTTVVHAQNWVILPKSNSVRYQVRNLGIQTSGTFSGLKGEIQGRFTEPATLTMDVQVDAASVNSGIDLRDDHLRGKDYFNVQQYPTIRIRSTQIVAKDGGYEFIGKIQMKGREQGVRFPFTAKPIDKGFQLNGKFTLKRKSFDIGGTSTVGDEVTILLDVTLQSKL